ncbi:MAG: phage holin family protein [Microbacteriaceae bacterium]|jgi:hypothetical protein|nr:phage holin family protein [Microbacteriaceae bacterium]
MSDVSQKKRSLFALLGDLPHLLVDLIRGEIDNLKQEMVGKLKKAGIGIGLFVGAGIFAFFALSALVAAAILGIAEALPAWASALIVAGALLVITAILALVGLSQLKRGVPPAPTETIKSVRQDVNAIKGIGKRAS